MQTEIEKIAEKFIFHYNNNDFYPLYRLLKPDAVMQLDDRTVLGSGEIVKYFKQIKFQDKQEVRFQGSDVEECCFQINAIDDCYKIKFDLECLESEYQIVSIRFGFAG